MLRTTLTSVRREEQLTTLSYSSLSRTSSSCITTTKLMKGSSYVRNIRLVHQKVDRDRIREIIGLDTGCCQ